MKRRGIPDWYYTNFVDSRGVSKVWGKQPVRFRLEQCRAMLYLHGILTEDENRRVQTRLIRAARAVEVPS